MKIAPAKLLARSATPLTLRQVCVSSSNSRPTIRTPRAVASMATSSQQSANDDWRQQAPYKQSETDFKIKYRSSCLCGAVEYAVDAEPKGAKFCHCVGCQRLHGPHSSCCMGFRVKQACLIYKLVSSVAFWQVLPSSGQQCSPKSMCASSKAKTRLAS